MAQNDTEAFEFFQRLHEEIRVAILSFVGDAPFESLPANYPKSSLTHTLPLVSKGFHGFSKLDCLWKAAIERQVSREPFLWAKALRSISGSQVKEDESEKSEDLVDRAFENHSLQNQSGYKGLYERIASNHLRMKGPVFFMSGQIQLGEAYGLHFFEPRYRLLMQEVMRGQPDSAKNNGPIHDPVYFIHANRTPLAPTTPAAIVQVIRCQLYPDGRADVFLMPTAYVWLEKIWVRPDSGHLYYAQVLRMGADVTNSMNKLARQEIMTDVMSMFANTVERMDNGEHLFSDDDSTEETT